MEPVPTNLFSNGGPGICLDSDSAQASLGGSIRSDLHSHDDSASDSYPPPVPNPDCDDDYNYRIGLVRDAFIPALVLGLPLLVLITNQFSSFGYLRQYVLEVACAMGALLVWWYLMAAYGDRG